MDSSVTEFNSQYRGTPASVCAAAGGVVGAMMASYTEPSSAWRRYRQALLSYIEAGPEGLARLGEQYHLHELAAQVRARQD